MHWNDAYVRLSGRWPVRLCVTNDFQLGFLRWFKSELRALLELRCGAQQEGLQHNKLYLIYNNQYLTAVVMEMLSIRMSALLNPATK